MYLLITPTSYLICRVSVIMVASLVIRAEDKQTILLALLSATVRRNQHVLNALHFLRIMAGVILMDGASVSSYCEAHSNYSITYVLTPKNNYTSW